jgi:hypothetical protein
MTSVTEQMLSLERRLDTLESSTTITAEQREVFHHRLVPPTPAMDCPWSCDFYAVCNMFDDGSRVEDMITQYYEEVPHLNYYDVTPGDTGKEADT